MGNGPDLAFKRRHYHQVVQIWWKLGKDLGTMASSEAGNGKCRLYPHGVVASGGAIGLLGSDVPLEGDWSKDHPTRRPIRRRYQAQHSYSRIVCGSIQPARGHYAHSSLIVGCPAWRVPAGDRAGARVVPNLDRAAPRDGDPIRAARRSVNRIGQPGQHRFGR